MSYILMMRRRLFFTVLFVAGALPAILAQGNGGLLEQARSFEARRDWASAAACYEAVVSGPGAAGTEVFWRYANCLRELLEYRQAEEMYMRVWRQDSLHYPEVLFHLAVIRKNSAEYREASKLFSRYLQKECAACDTTFRSRARMEIQACAWAEKALLQPEECSLDRLPPKVNSPYSESNVRPYGDSVLYFTSLQPVTKNEHSSVLDDYYASRIYKARVTSDGITTVRALPSRLNHPQYNNGNICFNAAHTRLYMTRSRVAESAASEIWAADFRDGKWQKPYRLGPPVNLPGTVSTHPHIVEADGQEILYFVSDRDGGYGGLDIWYALQDDEGRFQSVVNVGGTVNSNGNELTPFYDLSTQKLYFSSDGYPGFGGYDVYEVSGGLNSWHSKPENLGYPLNSPANEVYFVCSESGMKGFFASNRRSERALSDAVCCNDLYFFQRTRKQMTLHTDTFWCSSAEPRATAYAQNAVSLLPLTLYFHNDEPDPRSKLDTTETDYHSTLALYLAMQPVYMEAYAEGLNGAEADSARQRIRNFFADSLSRGYRTLCRFLDYLREDLESGSRVTLNVEGHASPLFSDSYNMHLSSRRIYSLWNTLLEYERGVFVPYIASGRLRFEHNPKGNRQAKPYVSDNPNDRRNSVYSVAAALERRIRIVGYSSVPEGADDTLCLCRLPSDRFVFKERPGTDSYCFRIQLRNITGDTLHLEFVSGSEDVVCAVEGTSVPPHSPAFVTVAFGSRLFELQPGRKALLRLRAGEVVQEIPLSFSFFKQK